jgi:hypothetical protein
MRFKTLLVIFLFVAIPIIASAQPGPGGPGDRVPITGGIVYLLLMAFGIGIKYFSKKKKSN